MTAPAMNGFSDVAKARRETVIDAATAIIATQGIHRLSLGNIETRVQMKRGHLTYYFPTKEAILLAVLDRMIERMVAQSHAGEGPKPGTGNMWECLKQMYGERLQPPGAEHRAFLSLIHTFHAQMNFREDVRKRLAELNADWRARLAEDYERSVPDPPVAPAVAASLMMALVQGLSGQLAVDATAFDRDEMLSAVLTLLAPLFARKGPSP